MSKCPLPAKQPRRIVGRDGPDPVDVHVGLRLSSIRIVRGMSQEALGNIVGLTFQQIQKYERGANRVSASKLHAFADTFTVPEAFFFDGLNGRKPAVDLDNLGLGRQDMELIRNVKSLAPEIQQNLRQLASQLAGAAPRATT